MAVSKAARMRWWLGVVAWALWAMAVAGCLVIPWLDDLLRRAGRADLVQWDARPGVAAVITVTVGAVLASRRPRHPVGWLLLAQTVVLLAPPAPPRSTWPEGCWPPAGRSRPPARWPSTTPPPPAGG